MKQLIRLSFLVAFLVGLQSQLMAQHHITVKIDDYKNDTCILGYRLGKQTYVRDTSTTKNDEGAFVFKGEESLEGGIYLILTKPNNVYFEFLVPDKEDQKNLKIKTKLINGNDMSTHLKIEGSADNQAFLDYLAYLRKMREKDMGIAEKLKDAGDNENKVKELNLEREQIGTDVEKYQKDLIAKNPDYLSSALVKASIQPEMPEEIRENRELAFYWYREHFWDNFNFADERMIRTPIFEDKITQYTEKLAVQMPDSVIVAVETILQGAVKGKNDKVFQYVAAELLNKYAKTKVICMDAVYVHIGEKYYCTGQATWVDSAQLVKICENVATLKPLRCGAYAPNIRLKKMDGTPVNLYELKGPFTAVYFWDPTCGNCSKTSKKLVPVYEKYKKYGFEVFGICSKTWKDLDQCKKKVKDQKMNFINTSEEAYPLAVAKKMYDIKVNPYIMLLDKDKKIMWKRIDPKQVDDILAREYEKLGIEIEVTDEVQEALDKAFQVKEKDNEKKVGVKGGGH